MGMNGMGGTAANGNAGGVVQQISISPFDGTQLAVVGDRFCRIYRYAEGGLRPLTTFLCHDWISNEKLAVGCSDGTIFIVNQGEVVQEISLASPATTTSLLSSSSNTGARSNGAGALGRIHDNAGGSAGQHHASKPPHADHPHSSHNHNSAGHGNHHHGSNNKPTAVITESVECIINLSTRGFLASGKGGYVWLFEKYQLPGSAVTAGGESGGDNPNTGKISEKYRLTKRFPLPDEHAEVRTMALNASEGSLVVELTTNQIWRIPLVLGDIIKGEDPKFEPLSQPFHHGPITSLDICLGRKPLIITASPSDRDKLRLMNVLMDDLRLFREFGIRGCRECRFSNGGHIFAAVHGNMIQLFSTWTFENIGNLKGHNGKVRSLYWTTDDSMLVSAGSDGAVYTWNVSGGSNNGGGNGGGSGSSGRNGSASGSIGMGSFGGDTTMKRENEHILKTCNYSSAVCSPDGKTTWAVGSDRMIKEITDSMVTRELESNTVITQLVMSHSGRMMFAGTANGTVRSIKFPLSDIEPTSETTMHTFASPMSYYQEHEAHCGSITNFRVSYDDQYLFSTSDDGCIYLFRISEKDDHRGAVGMKRERGMISADEILITKSDLEEKTTYMAELQRNLEELKLEHEYQLRLKDMNFSERLKEVTEKFSQEIEALKISTSVLRTEKDKEEVKHEEELQLERTRQAQELHEMESKYNQELMDEYEKFQDLQAATSSRQEKWQVEMRDFEKSMQKLLAHTQADYESRLKVKGNEIAVLQDTFRQQLRENAETQRQTSEDIDTEIQQLISKYEKKLRAEREEGARLKGENGIMRKKFNSLSKDIDDNKSEILKMKDDERKLQIVIAGLEKEISGLKKEMSERDELIQDKERRVYDLKKKNQELEKFKFVLDYRIKELKQQVEPRENEIADMTEEIQTINTDLEEISNKKQKLEAQISDLNAKLDATKQVYSVQHRRLQDIMHHIKVYRIDLHDAVNYIQEPVLLKKTVEQLYRKYCLANSRKGGKRTKKPRAQTAPPTLHLISNPAHVLETVNSTANATLPPVTATNATSSNNTSTTAAPPPTTAPASSSSATTAANSNTSGGTSAGTAAAIAATKTIPKKNPDLNMTMIDVDVQKECLRQQEYLKEQIAGLRKKIEVNDTVFRTDNLRTMMDNGLFIKYVSQLHLVTSLRTRCIPILFFFNAD
ncbi:Cilia- and flagella-associated protein 57 [Quaeritorhiza haematococci]|nr:Cilia- and flagella-associated protein 57 [Quaeritorhiza haematococci]